MTRSPRQRMLDTLAALERETELWISVVRRDGAPHSIPLSFVWDGEHLVIATYEQSVTTNALRRTGRARVALPSTSDVVLIDVEAQIVTVQQINATTDMLFRRAAGFDPGSTRETFVYALLKPTRIQAWRNEPEIARREVMILGRWVDDD